MAKERPTEDTPFEGPKSTKGKYNQDGGLSLNEEEWLSAEEAWDEMDAERAAERKAKEAKEKPATT